MHFQQEEGSLAFLPHSVNRRKGCEEGETPSDGRFALPGSGLFTRSTNNLSSFGAEAASLQPSMSTLLTFGVG